MGTWKCAQYHQSSGKSNPHHDEVFPQASLDDYYLKENRNRK
jgi:hypothetical protein